MDTNTIVLAGNLVRDPESITTKNGKTIVKFSVANNRGFGEFKTTNFINCTSFGKLGEIILKYCVKGKKVNVTGELRQNTYTNKDGKKVSTFEIRANEIALMGGGKSGDTANHNGQGSDWNIDPSVMDEDVPF